MEAIGTPMYATGELQFIDTSVDFVQWLDLTNEPSKKRRVVPVAPVAPVPKRGLEKELCDWQMLECGKSYCDGSIGTPDSESDHQAFSAEVPQSRI
jgi:hypothetical protein